MLRHLIFSPNKIEPRSILYSRRSVIAIYLVLLIGFFVILCDKTVNEQPNISTTLRTKNNLLAPVIYLGLHFEFTVSCFLYYNYNGTKARKCDEYITQAKNIGHDDYPLVAKFSPNLPNLPNITLNRYDDSEGPYFVFLHINITDPNLTFNDSAQDSSFRMVAYDSENEYDTLNKDFVAPTSLFEQSLFYLNKYTLSNGLIYKFGYSKKLRKTLAQNSLSYFGITTYLTKPYIESIIQTVPIRSSENNITLRISPRSFVIEEEREQRSDTLLDIIGTITALYSGVVFLYVFLFGADSVKPWGVLHRIYGFKNLDDHEQERLLEFILPSAKEGHDPEIGLEGNRNLETPLEKRISGLEEFIRFLGKYVIDISSLETFKTFKEKKKAGEKKRNSRIV